MTKTIIITKKDGSIITAERNSPILETVNVHEIDSMEIKYRPDYEPQLAFKPNHNYQK